MTNEHPDEPFDSPETDALEASLQAKAAAEQESPQQRRERLYFARIFSRADLDHCVELLRIAAGGSLAGLIQDDSDMLTVSSPQRETVLIAIMSRPDVWVARLHRAVFDPDLHQETKP